MKIYALFTITIFTILIGSNLYSQNSPNEPKHFANFKLNDQYSDKKSTNKVVLKDLDNDGDLDAVCANMGYNNSQVLFNDGNGNFTDSEQKLTQQGHGVGVEDLNGDGSPDIFITCAGYKGRDEKEYNNKPSKIYFNNGKGQFSDSDQHLGDTDLSGNGVILVDLDSDGDIDVVVQYNQNPDILYLNNGVGHFTKSNISIPENSLFLDMDADGDMDIFCREFGLGFKVLVNDKGQFSEHWTLKDSTVVNGDASFGDLDNDNDLDIVVINGNRNFSSPTKVLLNNGNGIFTDSGQKLPASIFGRICIADLNGDKTQDLLISSLGEANIILSNDGKGKFTTTSSIIGSITPFQRPVIEDINNDGVNDVFIANFDGGSNQYSNEIWINQNKHIKGEIDMKEPLESKMQKIDERLSYSELESKAIDFFRKDSIDTAIDYMEYALDKFPEKFPRTTNILANIYTRSNNLSNAIEIWRMGINKGYIYDLNNAFYQEYYKDNADFEELVKMEQSRLDSLHLSYEVFLPTEFNDKKTYPILFIFHGNGRNMAKSKISWRAPIMDKKFITVFMQSYMPSPPNNFNWIPNDEKTDKEFKEIYDNIMKTYLVGPNKIIFAGMSAGGYKAIEFAFNDFVPISGLVLNCPVIPPDINEATLKQFVEHNKRIGIITGENDFALAAQKTLLSDIENLNGKTKMIVHKDLGHVFAEDFSIKLDEYLKWVIE